VSNGRPGQSAWEAFCDPASASSASRIQDDSKTSHLLRSVKLFETMGDAELEAAAEHLEQRSYQRGATIIRQGDQGHEFFLIDVGECVATVQAKEGEPAEEILRYRNGSSFGERALLRSEPRAATITAVTAVKAYVLNAIDFQNLIRERDRREECLRGVKLLEMMSIEQIAKAAGALERRSYDVGDKIIVQGEEGNEFFIIDSGQCVATVATGADEQEVKRYEAGDLFGELALKEGSPRAATVTALTPVKALVLSRENFEKQLGPLNQLHADQYLADPRKLIVDFYRAGDDTGPAGSLTLRNRTPNAKKQSKWFCVCRPTSRDSIAKMLGRIGVGKGLNIKGKSAKKNRLSGFVPFLQISDNKHKSQIEQSPPDARLRVFYRSSEARKEALEKLQQTLQAGWERLRIEDESINMLDEYAPDMYGLELPEVLLREVYIEQSDISPMVGWETGRPSIPQFMDMNLHAIRGGSSPKVCLYQFDQQDALNPLGLLLAYAEELVKPVVSDFDTFLIGSTNMEYDKVPPDQMELMKWCLDRCSEILGGGGSGDWTKQWLEMMEKQAAKGFHPELPKFGFGDATSVKIITDVVKVTSPCGAVRHGAECFNFTFPQELDDEYLVLWDEFAETGWEYKTEPELRQFLLERIKDGYVFPINAAWPVRDPGWYEVLQALRNSPSGGPMSSWFLPETYMKIDALHRQFPEGFKMKK